jgi:hypothetical protein
MEIVSMNENCPIVDEIFMLKSQRFTWLREYLEMQFKEANAIN